MAGWKDWQVGEVVTEADFQAFLQDQVIFVFDDAAARDAAIGTAFRKEGMFAFLKDADGLEYFAGPSLGWVPFAAGARGGGTDQIFYENGTAVTTDYTITTGTNAMTAGPVEIQVGATVAVPVGSVWTVV
jgi:hypothetical protein